MKRGRRRGTRPKQHEERKGEYIGTSRGRKRREKHDKTKEEIDREKMENQKEGNKRAKHKQQRGRKEKKLSKWKQLLRIRAKTQCE